MTSRVDVEYLADLIYAAAVQGDEWQDCFRRIGRALGADCIGLLRHDAISGTGSIENADGIGPTFLSDYAHHAPNNVWFRDMSRLAVGSVLKGAELVPLWEIVRTDFYREWLRPQNVLHAVLGVISRDGATLRSLVALREGKARPFGNCERALVASLLPHLSRALVLAARVREDRQQTSMLIELFHHAPQAILVVDQCCQIRLKNRAAEEMLARDNGLRTVGDRLCLSAADENRRFRELVAAKAGIAGTSERMLVIHSLHTGCPLLLTISPMLTRLGLEGERAALLLAAISARDQSRCDHLSPTELQHLLGLTPTEAKLASLILRGHGLLDSAAVLHISKNTARTHMKRIYSKTALHRQPDLRRLLDPSVFEPEPGALVTPRGDDRSQPTR